MRMNQGKYCLFVLWSMIVACVLMNKSVVLVQAARRRRNNNKSKSNANSNISTQHPHHQQTSMAVARPGGERRCLDRSESSSGIAQQQQPFMTDISQSRCMSCTKQSFLERKPKKRGDSNGDSDGFSSSHLAVVLSPWLNITEANAPLHPTMNLMSRLIEQGHTLSLLHIFDKSCELGGTGVPGGNTGFIAEQILRSLPCELEVAPDPLSGVAVGIESLGLCDDDGVPFSHIWESSPYQHLRYVEPILTALRKLGVQSERPELVIVDAANVGAVLWAQQSQIPIVMQATLHHVELMKEKDAKSKSVKHFLTRRWDSFLVGFSFARLNVIRRLMGLELYRMPSDYFEFVDAIIYEYHGAQSESLPEYLFPVAPTIPKCVPCNSTQESPNQESVGILVLPTDISILDLRVIVRGIAMARNAFNQQLFELQCGTVMDANQTDKKPVNSAALEKCKLMKKRAGVEAIILDDGLPSPSSSLKNVPEMLPDFISVEQSNFVDALIRYNNTRVIIAQCDSESHLGHLLGVVSMCIPKNPAEKAGRKSGFQHLQRASVLQTLTHFLAAEIRPANNARVISAVDVVDAISRLTKRNSSLTRSQVRKGVQDELNYHPENRDLVSRTQHQTIMIRANATSTTSVMTFLFYILKILINFFLVVACIHALYFLEFVDQPNKVRGFRRKIWFLSTLFEDMYPALIAFQEWYADEKTLHNVLIGKVANQDDTRVLADRESSELRGQSHGKRDQQSRKKKTTRKK